MNTYEQLELDLVTEIEELETKIKERTEFIKENATREFPLTNYSRITYAMERKLDNLEQSLKHLQRSLEYLQADVKGGTEEQQAEEQKQAEKEEAAVKAKQQKQVSVATDEIQEEIDLKEVSKMGFTVGDLVVLSGNEYSDNEVVEEMELAEIIDINFDHSIKIEILEHPALEEDEEIELVHNVHRDVLKHA